MTPTNSTFLQQVSLYHIDQTAYLLNTAPFVSNSNMKHLNFNANAYNRGLTTSFSLQPRMAGNHSLTAVWQDAEQRIETITADQQFIVPYAFTADQFVTQTKDFMDIWGKTAAITMSGVLEDYMANKLVEKTNRFFGDGVTAINSYQQLASIGVAQNYYGVNGEMKGFIPSAAVPPTIGTGLSQFIPDLNDKVVLSWKLGTHAGIKWFASTKLQTHVAGDVGNSDRTLTITGVTRGTDSGITHITCSGAEAGSIAFNKYDLMSFKPGVTGQPDVRLCSFVGGYTTPIPMQMATTEIVTASGTGNVIIPLNPIIYDPQSITLNATNARLKNTNVTIEPGMQIKGIRTHLAGAVVGGNGMLFSSIRLADKDPYKTANAVDPVTGMTFRKAWGSQLSDGNVGFVDDIQFGGQFITDMCIRVCFPVSQGNLLI